MSDTLLDQVREAIDKAVELPVLGYVVTWRLRGVTIRRDSLAEALDAAGFKDHLPALPSPRLVMRRALEAYVRSVLGATHSTSNGALKRMVRVANPPGAKHIVYAVVDEKVDWPSLGLGYTTGFRVLMDKETGVEIICTPTVEGPILASMQDETILDALRPHLDDARLTFRTGDLGDLVAGILRGKLNALPMRHEGGAYVVPAAEKPRLDALQKLVAGLSGASMLVALPILDVENARPQMALAIHAALGDELDGWTNDLADFAEKEPGTVRESTVKRRLAIYQNVRQRAEAYADVLGERLKEILVRVEHLETAARSLRETLPETVPDDGQEEEVEEERIPYPLFATLEAV